jgi:hypothetical protein
MNRSTIFRDEDFEESSTPADPFVADTEFSDFDPTESRFRPFGVTLPAVPEPTITESSEDRYQKYWSALESDPIWDYLTTFAYAADIASVEKLFLDRPPPTLLTEEFVNFLEWYTRDELTAKAFQNLDTYVAEQTESLTQPSHDRELAQWDQKRWRGLKPFVIGSATKAARTLAMNFTHLKQQTKPDYYVNSVDADVRAAFALLAGTIYKRDSVHRSTTPTFDKSWERLNLEVSDALDDTAFKSHQDGGKHPWSTLEEREIPIPLPITVATLPPPPPF